MKRTGMMSIRDILRHRHGFGLTRAETAAAVGVSTGTVSDVLDRAAAAGGCPGRCRPISTMRLCRRVLIRRRIATAGMSSPTGMRCWSRCMASVTGGAPG